MKRKIYTMLCVFFLVSCSDSMFSIHGKVADGLNSTPIGNVKVKLKFDSSDTIHEVSTDSKGLFYFSFFGKPAKSSFTLSTSCNGYLPFDKTFSGRNEDILKDLSEIYLLKE
ncbi:MAG: carboxypeptidase regulatory-like domain-containing protein [Spirochaetales bacterium]|nr:carboxypeptidase regulatory-like domain-containing protein [Spirochaetales bacterium]